MKEKGDDTVKILKRLKVWIGFKALKIVRGALEEDMDEELEDALKETLVEFYVKKDIDMEDMELIGRFVDFAKEELVPHLLYRLENYLREVR